MLALVLALAGHDAVAAEQAELRVGQHDGFVRVVIESRHKIAYRYLLSPDGLSATIEAPGLAKPPSLPAPLAPLQAIGAAPESEPQKLRLTLSFATPVRLAHTLDLADPDGTRFRLALDYAPLGAALENLAPAAGDAKTASLPSAAAPEPAAGLPPAPWAKGEAPALPLPPPPALRRAAPAAPDAAGTVAPATTKGPASAKLEPAASDTVPAAAKPTVPAAPVLAGPSQPPALANDRSLAAGLRSVQFGANEGTLDGAIDVTFGADATLAHGGTYNPKTRERKTFISITAPFDDLGPAQGLYDFAPPGGVLTAVSFDWTGPSGGLSDDDRDRQIERLTAALVAAGFRRAAVNIDAAPPSVGWLAFAGSDGAGRAAQIWVIPTVPSAGPEAADSTADSNTLVRYTVRLAIAPLNGAADKTGGTR